MHSTDSPKLTKDKEPHVSPNTVQGTYIKVVRNNIVKAGIDDLGEPHNLKAWLDTNVPPGTAKRALMQLSAACKWAVSSGLIPDNPYLGLYNTIKVPKSTKGGDDDEWDIRAFTAEERDIVLEAFSTSHYYRYYDPYVYFCFYTGCRPNEAQALMWKHVKSNKIVFEQRVVTNSQGRLEIMPGTKTEPRRTFPINSQLNEFLNSIRPENVNPEALVFPGPKGSIMDQHNFCNRAWKKTLEQCGIEYRVPYQMRHTFITLTLKKETDVETVAKWVGNSAQIIWEHYASGDKDLIPPEL